jgi:hypothetical protein
MYNSNTNKMHTNEIIYIYNNLLHVLATHTAIFREAIHRIKIKRWHNYWSDRTNPKYKMTKIKSEFKIHKIRCYYKCAIIEWMVYTDVSCSNAPSYRMYWCKHSKPLCTEWFTQLTIWSTVLQKLALCHFTLSEVIYFM